MPLHDFECPGGHVFEAITAWDNPRARCQCGKQGRRTFLPQAARRGLRDPIVLHRHADGTYGVPGRTDAPTPAGAERIEIRNMAEYDSVMRKWNGQEGAKAQRSLEAASAAREQVQAAARAELHAQLARTDNPLARDLLRAALDRPTAPLEPTFRPFRNEAMEMWASNREGCYDGRTGHSRHK